MTHDDIDEAADAIRQAMDNGGWRRTIGNLPELIRLAHAGLDAQSPDTKTAARNADG